MRSVSLSIAVIFFGAQLLQRVELVYSGPAMAYGPLPALSVLLLLLLAVLRGVGGGWLRLHERELFGCYLMTAVGLPLAGSGLSHYLLPSLVTGFFQFSDPGGHYHPFLKLIPDWMVPGRAGSEAVEAFFQGNVPVPWAAWFPVLLVWSALILAFCAALWGIMTLMRTRWLEEERLRLPLTELPVAIATEGWRLARSRILLAGVVVPIAIHGANGLHHYLISPIEIPLSFNLSEVLVEEPWVALVPFTSRFEFTVSPFLIGIAYLLSLEISFSTWFFFLLTRVQLLTAELLGHSEDQGAFIGLGGQWREWPNFTPHFQSQARGGILCLAVLSLWAARRSLAAAGSRALAAAGTERYGVIGLVVGTTILMVWSSAAGLSLHLAAAYVSLLLLTAIGMARLRLDGGLPVVSVYFLIPNLFFFACGTGPGVFGPSEYVAFAFLNVLGYSSVAAVSMIHVEGWKMTESVEGRVCHVGLAVAIGLLAGLACGFWSMLETVHESGIFILDRHGGGRSAARVGRYYHYLYSEAGTRAAGADLVRLGAIAAGFFATAGMAYLRTLFVQLPFHPIGFVYGTGFGTLIWGSVLIGWVVKILVVRYGGAAQYRRLRPFFFGIILGDLTMRVVWAVVSTWGEPGSGFRL